MGKENVLQPQPELRKEGKFYLQPTQFPGVFIRTTESHGIDVPKRAIRKLFGLSKRFRMFKGRMERASLGTKSASKELVDFARDNDGLRGIQSEQDNFYLNVTPKTKEWNQELLKEATGSRYGSLVTQSEVYSVTVPSGFVSDDEAKEELREVFVQILIDKGMSKEEADERVTSGTNFEVDAKRISKLEEKGVIELPHGTRKTSWEVKTDRLHKI